MHSKESTHFNEHNTFDSVFDAILKRQHNRLLQTHIILLPNGTNISSFWWNVSHSCSFAHMCEVYDRRAPSPNYICLNCLLHVYNADSTSLPCYVSFSLLSLARSLQASLFRQTLTDTLIFIYDAASAFANFSVFHFGIEALLFSLRLHITLPCSSSLISIILGNQISSTWNKIRSTSHSIRR